MYCVALALVSMFTAARIPSSGSAAGQRRILFIYIAIETLSRTFHFCFFVDVFYFFFFVPTSRLVCEIRRLSLVH